MMTSPTTSSNEALLHLIVLAVTILGEHTSDDTTHTICAACGSPWPCEPAITAEHNLALL